MTPFYVGNSNHNPRRCSSRFFCLNITIVGLLLFIAVFYLIEINNLAAATYKIDGLKQRIHELEVDNQKLEINTNQLESLDNLYGWASQQGLASIIQYDYLKVPVSVVAVK